LRRGEIELHLPSYAREVFDVTGAGDTVIATLGAALGANLELDEAAALANLAAGIVVSKLGTAAIGALELRRHVALAGDAERGVVGEEQLLLAVQAARARDERLVMTNGCFDILHAGHVAFLERARQLGDRLIVAVNDDASVQKLKGAGRPVNNLKRRMVVLAALNCVDWVVPFVEDTPERLICAVLPDFLVKGSDYRPELIAGGDCVRAAGGEVRVLDLVPDVSTTKILQTLREPIR
jgi:D-beta-D-heptose 7-phosphate kinase/D-beta-D-heptose 1-phosphate adenosyltransferase